MKILVTDGNNRATLAIVRSLGKQGHILVVGEQKQPSLAACSKYCSKEFHYPDPYKSSHQFIDKISRVLSEENIDVLVPVSEITTLLVTQSKKKLEKQCKIPFADFNTVLAAANKAAVAQLATRLKIGLPKTIYLDSYKKLAQTKIDIPFPLVLKPHMSRIQTKSGWQSTTVTYAQGMTELQKILKYKQETEYPMLLQERIEGPGIGIFVLFNNGELIASFSHKRLREKPPSGGVSTLRESVAIDPLAMKDTQKLLSALKWHGVAMVEFKLDMRDNIPKLMEINGRFWGSLQLAIDAGVDFPALLIKTLNNKQIESVTDYNVGVKTRWFLGDLDSLLLILLKNKKTLNLPDNFGSKTKYILSFMKIWQKNQYYEIESFNDAKPWIFEWRQWLKH